MEDLKTIIKGTTAKLAHVCCGKVYYEIETEQHKYLLEINSVDDDLKTTYLVSEYKAVTLMRWIRKGMSNGTFIMLS